MTALLDKGFYDFAKADYVVPPRQFRCFMAVIREAEGEFSVLVLNLPGAVGSGDTEEDAVSSACDAVRLVAEDYEENGDAIPWSADFEVPEGVKLRKVLVDATIGT